MKRPVLCGVGVGPGDPELLTLKAVRVLREADFVFVPASTKNEYSLALRVAAEYIPPERPIEHLPFPMTRDREKLEQAWEENARKVVEKLRVFSKVVFLAMGDPALYSTFGYLARWVRRLYPKVEIRMTPGITAAQAAAARFNLILTEGEEAFVLASGLAAEEVLKKFAGEKTSFALYKVYRRAPEIIEILRQTKRLKDARAISWCGFPEEIVYEDATKISGSTPPYFTLLLVGGKPLD